MIIDPLNPSSTVSSQHEHQHKARRLRGGGAARDCFIGAIECFICFECCKVEPENTCVNSPIRTVASAAPTSSAALARCAAECVPKQPNADGTMLMTVTILYIFFII
ncbi:hypothetical protein BGY98DRAFT_672261 [Russula aff. rugulosa BPL654]|nr:hypothetical protein BGY98DRAFT_672261 [Russula aff. rugulosa BPL654]